MPHSARIWNYWLGGKDNYAVDREAGDRYREEFPGIVDMARAARGFLARAVWYLAADAGIRQFLDIGTGLPTADNTHEVAQRAAPDSRVVYVDNDPLVLTHARALLTSTPAEKTAYVDADVYEPGKILHAAAETLDFTRPTALMLMGILGHVDGYEEARSLVNQLLEPLPPGSHLVLYDGTATRDELVEAQEGYNEGGPVPYHLRSREQVAGFFEGLELVEPGVVPCSQWRPDAPSTTEVSTVGGVGRKP